MAEKNDKIAIYRSPSGEIELKVDIEDETIWLTQKQMADLFGVNRPAVTKHLSNIFKSGELSENLVCSKMEQMAPDQVKYVTKLYDLDAIISVGYRVNSLKATNFRVWATKTLRDFLVKGYAVNEKRLLQEHKRFSEIKKIFNFLGEKAQERELIGHERELNDLVFEYAKSWRILEDFDAGRIVTRKRGKSIKFTIAYDGVLELIGQMREQLSKVKVNVYLFGTEYGDKLKAILGAVNQTFDGKDLYPGVEEKAAHILYLVIKDHPFADGNKRIGSMLFLYFLENNDFLYRENDEKKISDNTIIALALLIATSNPDEKDNMIKLIISLLQD